MGLEMRKGRDGELIMHWFGAYKDETGKRIIRSLTTPIAGDVIPKSLLEKGDEKFEASRAAAIAELKLHTTSSKEKGRAQHLTARLIEAKTGRKWKETPLEALPGLVLSAKHRRERSKQNEAWKVKTIQNFVQWAKEKGLRTSLQVTPEIAEAYIASFYVPDDKGLIRTAESVRKIKALVGHVLSMTLPDGVENPLKRVTVETPDGDKVFNREPLNAVEIERLLEAAADDRTAFDLIVTGLSTGLRRGDVCRLRWESVDQKNWVLKLTTSKTRAELYLPIMPRLRTVLQGRLAERDENAEYVFPEAERQLRTNPSGVSWRIKRAFALAFAKPPDAKLAGTPELVPLSETLPTVLQVVQTAKMPAAKRAKMIDLLNRYASGQSYRVIQQEKCISRGGISILLHQAQDLANVRFLPDAQAPGINAAIRDVTREKREVGLKAASKYDFHGLRTTFVTLALNAGIGVDKLKALTGHNTVEVVLKHYFKPRGTEVAGELEAALPDVLTGRTQQEAKAALPVAKNDPVAEIAAKIGELSKGQRKALTALLVGRKVQGRVSE